MLSPWQSAQGTASWEMGVVIVGDCALSQPTQSGCAPPAGGGGGGRRAVRRVAGAEVWRVEHGVPTEVQADSARERC